MPDAASPRRGGWWLGVVPLLLLMTALGARGLQTDAFWLDETWSLYSAGAAHFGPLSPAEIWTRTATEDFGGVGYHLILSAWGSLAGWTPFALRLSSLLFGLLAAAWIFRLGRTLASPAAGLAAAVAFGAGAFTVYFLHELRTFTLSVLLIALTLWAYWRAAWSRRPGLGAPAALVAGTAGLLYTHYYLALILLAIGLYHLLFAPRGRCWLRTAGLLAAGGLLFLPWTGVVLAALRQFTANEAAGSPEPALTAVQIVERTAVLFSSGMPWLLGAALLLASLNARAGRRAAVAAGLWTLAGLAVLIVVNDRTALVKPGRERYLLLVWPPLALLAGIGLARLRGRGGRAAFAILLAAWAFNGAAAALDGALTRDTDGAQAFPWDALARTLAAEAEPGDAVAVELTVYNWVLELKPAEYYLHGLPARFTVLQALPEADFADRVRALADGAPQIFLGLDKRLPPTPRWAAFQAALAGEYAPCETLLDLPRLRLDRLLKLPTAAFAPERAYPRFGEGIRLTYSRVTADVELSALLVWWAAPDVPANVYSVGLHLVDAADNLVAQADYGLPSEAAACRLARLTLDGLPPGSYRLLAMVYDWQTGARLPGLSAAGEAGDRLLLAEVRLK